MGTWADPGYTIYQAPKESCLTGTRGNTLSTAQPRRTGLSVAACPLQPARNVTGCYFAECTGLKTGLQLHLSTRPGCAGGKRPSVGVIVVLLCPSKSLTTPCSLNKYKYHYTHITVRNTGRGGKRCCPYHVAGKVRLCTLDGLLFQTAFAVSAPTHPTARSSHPGPGAQLQEDTPIE